MNFDRIAGFASAGFILLILTLNGWLGLWGPVWKAAWEMTPGDALSLIVAVVGWIVTIGIGSAAYLMSQRQIRLAQAQITLQQQQIAEARAEQRRANFARLDAAWRALAHDIDLLITAAGYLGVFAGRFLHERDLDGWSSALIFARQQGADAISASAIAAPFGYGERISTVMNRIQRIGDGLAIGLIDAMPSVDRMMRFEPTIKEAVTGIRKLASQIPDELPARRAQMLALMNERDIYAPGQDAAALNDRSTGL